MGYVQETVRLKQLFRVLPKYLKGMFKRLLQETISNVRIFIKQLYEYFYLERNGIRKLQKNISSELLASFGRQLTETEDIPAQLNESVLN